MARYMERIYNGLGTDLKRRCNGGKTGPVSGCVFGNRYYVTIAACGSPYISCVLYVGETASASLWEKKGNIVSVTK